MSVYQSNEWKNARITGGAEHVKLGILAFARKKSFPLIGNKKILFAEGNPKDLGSLNEFKEASKKYLYGTISPTVLKPNHGMFKKEGLWKVSNHTILLDLKKSEKELWSSLEKKSVRWGAGFAERNGLKFFKAESSDIKEFYELYSKTAEEGGFEKEEIRFIESLRDTKISKLFVVKKNERIYGGALLLIDLKNKYSILNLASVSEEGQKLQAMPFIYWNLILYSKRSGREYMDLGGYDKESKEGSKLSNINRFKERFGGSIMEQPVYSTNFIYPFFRTILRFKKKVI